MTALRRIVPIVFALAIGALSPVAASAAQTTTLEVKLIDMAGDPISGASVELDGVTPSVGSAPAEALVLRCDDRGSCTAARIAPGSYTLIVRTPSTVATLASPIRVTSGGPQRIVVRVTATGAAIVASLGVIRITPAGALSTASAPSTSVDAQAQAARGDLNLSNSLGQQAGVTIDRPNGGSPGLPSSAVIRGDDPKETIVQLDGFPINSGSTGAFDLSLLDPSAFQNVQVVYGLAPGSLVGANTEGGTINFLTLAPTPSAQGFLRYSFGSFVSHGYTVATTGPLDRFGYAFELHSFNQQGEVNDYPVVDADTGVPATLGSGISGSNALAKLSYALPRNGFVEASVLTLGYNEDLSAPVSTPANPDDVRPGAPFTSYAGSERSNATAFYDVDARLALGRADDASGASAFLTARYNDTNARQTVTGPAQGLSEYLLDSTDLLNNASLQYERLLPHADLTLAAWAQGENLTVPDGTGAPDDPTQTNHTFAVRYTWDGGARLEYTGAAYLSTFSAFGTSFNPRAAVVWRPTPQTVVRASAGTGFQAPTLLETIVPSPLPPPDANGLINVGNPDLSADRTVEYELDAEHTFGSSPQAISGELDLYHVDQRDDDIQYIPAGASPENPNLSYPVNIAQSIWQGAALHVDAPVGAGIVAQAMYNINRGYPLALPAAFVSSAGNLVPRQQFQGVPLHRATFSLEQRGRLSWLLAMTYEGINNDLSQPQFAAVNASLSYSLRHTTVALAAGNLTDVYTGRFSLAGAGIPYPGLTAPIPTDAYQLQVPSLTVMLTQNW
jgi:outer membrane receptor protein involved in Fe transport